MYYALSFNPYSKPTLPFICKGFFYIGPLIIQEFMNMGLVFPHDTYLLFFDTKKLRLFEGLSL